MAQKGEMLSFVLGDPVILTVGMTSPSEHRLFVDETRDETVAFFGGIIGYIWGYGCILYIIYIYYIYIYYIYIYGYIYIHGIIWIYRPSEAF